MTERQEREYEELRTVDDILNEIGRLNDLMEDVADPQLDRTMRVLIRYLRRKYRYILKISTKWTKKQSFLSVLADKKEEKRINIEREREAERSPITKTQVEVIAKNNSQELLTDAEEDE